MNKLIACIALAASVTGAASAKAEVTKPTIVLVHGAFADASSWNDVIRILRRDGFPVIAVANPLRSVRDDATYVADILANMPPRVVLVGHSYGGSVISEAANRQPNVKALVYVAAFAPQAGESAALLSGKFSGSTLVPTLAPPVPLADGGKDLYIQQDRFPSQFAADVPRAQAELMAAGQRPITEAALNEKSNDGAWTRIPSWFVYGDADRNIPPAMHAFMAARASSHQTVVIKGGSHVVMVSHPDAVASLIEKAAAAE
jgi:pimeloyl-ACP methyl ester carboxylesterase